MTFFPSPQDGRSSGSVSDSAPSVGACASSQGADSRQHFAEERDGQSRVSHSLRNRVQRVEASLHLGRPVTDAELLQHARDCSDLMHVCYGLFEAGKGAEYRAEAQRWQYQAQHARACLSPEWKAKREAQIQSAIGSAHFMDDGDRAREQIAANEGKA
jgi:hypothetical protein